MTQEEAYKILGCTSDDDADMLRRAYQSLAKKHHPDRGGDSNLFRDINVAYDLLKRGLNREAATADQQARNALIAAFMAVCESASNEPLIKHLKRTLKNKHNELRTKVQQNVKKVGMFHRKASEFRRRQEGPNVLYDTLMSAATKLEQQNVEISKAMAVLERASAMADNYEDIIEEQTTPARALGIRWVTIGTSAGSG